MGNKPDHHAIYRNKAEQYDRLVSCEDRNGNLLREVKRVAQLEDAQVIEWGAGTGRLTRLLAPHVRTIRAFDGSSAMLEEARRRAAELNHTNCFFSLADHHDVEVEFGAADLAVGGWAICYSFDPDSDDWKTRLHSVLSRMDACLKPGGCVVILETQGTGVKTPDPPNHLLPYFSELERLGFATRWFRTDYEFATVDEAVELTGFFFGEALAEPLEKAGNRVLPECTGIWWRYRA